METSSLPPSSSWFASALYYGIPLTQTQHIHVLLIYQTRKTVFRRISKHWEESCEKQTKARNSLRCWELRRLNLLGKIDELIASQLVYVLSPLTTNQSAINEINMFFNFLWDGKGDKIKLARYYD